MTKRKVTVRGAASLRRVLRQAPEDMKREVAGAIATGEAAVLADMLANVPRGDTGDLASVVKAKRSRDGLSTRIGPGAAGKRDQKKAGKRAHFQEFGTVHQSAQPFVFPALRRGTPAFREAINRAVARALLKMARGG